MTRYSIAVRWYALRVAARHFVRAIGHGAELDVGACARELVHVFRTLGLVFGRSREPAARRFGATCQQAAPRLDDAEHAKDLH